MRLGFKLGFSTPIFIRWQVSKGYSDFYYFSQCCGDVEICKLMSFTLSMFFIAQALYVLPVKSMQYYYRNIMWLGQQQGYDSVCPNLDFYLAPPPRQLETSSDSCTKHRQLRGQSIAAAAAVAAAGLTLDVSSTLLRTSRDGYQVGDEERSNEWPGYVSDLLNMLDMLPEMHRNESIRVRYVRTPFNPPKQRRRSDFHTTQKVRRRLSHSALSSFY